MKTDKTGRSTGTPPHVRLHYWLMDTAAWRTLDATGRATLVELYGLFNGRNNGDLFLSSRELAKRINTNRSTANRALWALEMRGFIRAKSRGGYDYKAAQREARATVWVLTEFPHGTAKATKEFITWQPGEDYLCRVAKPAPWKSRKPKSPVTLERQTVTLERQLPIKPKGRGPNCHARVTDSPKSAGKLSRQSDSDNHHAREPVGSDGARPQGSAATEATGQDKPRRPTLVRTHAEELRWFAEMARACDLATKIGPHIPKITLPTQAEAEALASQRMAA